jgi:hypothetical protein
MKDFIIKNKYTILFAIAVLLDLVTGLQDIVGIPESVQTIIKVVGVFLLVFSNRVQEVNVSINASNLRANRNTDKGIINVEDSISVLGDLWRLFRDFWKYFNLRTFREENVLSHLLIGGGILMLTLLYNLPTDLWQTFVLLLVLALQAAAVGVTIELVQKSWYNGIPSNKDIITTTYGYLIMLPIGLLLIWVGLTSWYICLPVAVGLFYLAFRKHKDF